MSPVVWASIADRLCFFGIVAAFVVILTTDDVQATVAALLVELLGIVLGGAVRREARAELKRMETR